MLISQNEFIANDDYIGLFQSEPEPQVFLTIDSLIESRNNKPYNNELTSLEIKISISNRKNSLDRQVYSLLTLASDVGGFNGAIVIIPTYLMSFYSLRMFNASLLEEMPVRKNKKKTRSKKINNLKKKLSNGTQGETLDKVDVNDLYRKLQQTTIAMKTQFFKSLCFFKLFCKNDRELRFRKRAESLFEERLDIRSFIKLQASLALLLDLFLTKE